MTNFDPIRYAQLRQTKLQVGDKAPAKLNAELAALCAAQLLHTPSIDEIAQQAVEKELQQNKLQERIQELRIAHPDIDTPNQ